MNLGSLERVKWPVKVKEAGLDRTIKSYNIRQPATRPNQVFYIGVDIGDIYRGPRVREGYQGGEGVVILH